MKLGLFSYFSPETYRYVEGAQKMRQLFKLPQHEQQVASLSTFKFCLKSLFNTNNIDFDRNIGEIIPKSANHNKCCLFCCLLKCLAASLKNSIDPDQTAHTGAV